MIFMNLIWVVFYEEEGKSPCENRDTQRKCGITQAETTVTEFPAKEYQAPMATRWSWEEASEDVTQSLRGGLTLLTFWLQICYLGNCGRMNLCCFQPPSLRYFSIACPEHGYQRSQKFLRKIITFTQIPGQWPLQAIAVFVPCLLESFSAAHNLPRRAVNVEA